MIKSPGVKKSILKGTQKIIPSKKLTDPREDVTLLMLHLRLKEHDADILFTLNVPKKETHTESYENILNYHNLVFEMMCATVEIKDLSKLFG